MQKDKIKPKVTIIGYGTMGKAIAKALKGKALVTGVDLGNSKKSTKTADFVIMSVKPQDATEAVKEMRLGKNTILISIMAGVSIKKLRKLSGHNKILRMMPNLALSIAGWISEGLSASEKKKVKKFLDMVTENFEANNEEDINKVTAISGSGPAYFFLLAESMVKASLKLGLSKEASIKLVQKTFLASSLLGKNADYSFLIKKIASKKGTTEAALKIFKKNNFEKIVTEAITAAHKRAKELSK